MSSRIGRWGGSLSVRIPKNVASGAALVAGDRVYVRLLDSGDVLVRPEKGAVTLKPGQTDPGKQKVKTRW